ncbi:MAG: hypothetical protein AAFN41_12965, partial [Planctomycetota bacterium]
MSTAPPPSTRPARPMPARAPQTGGASAPVSIDPVKLFKKYFFVLAFAGVVGVAIGVGADILLRRFAPQFTARTVFEVDPPRRTVAAVNAGDVKKDELERYMASQAQAILSSQVLDRAVSDPNLVSAAPKWTAPFLDNNGRLITADAIVALQDTMVARAIPNTVYIELKLDYSSKDDVFTVVNVVTQAYNRFMRETTRTDQQPIRDQLSQRLRQLQDSIERDQSAVDRLLLENQIESVDARLTEAGEELDLAVRDRAGVQEQISIIETQMEEYQRELNDPAGAQIPDDIRERVRQDPLIQQLESQLQNIKARRRSQERLGFGPEHPVMKALQADIDGLQEEIASQTSVRQEQTFSAAINSLRLSLAQARALETELTDRIEVAQDRLTEIARIGQEVNALKRSVAQKQDRVSRTEEELDEVEGLLSVAEQGRVSVFQPPRRPEHMSFPRRIVVIPAAFLLILGITVAIILIRELLDQRVKGSWRCRPVP